MVDRRMMNLSNRVIGLVSLVTLILLIPTMGVGLWLTKKSKGIACEDGIQMVFLVAGMVILMVSLCGFAGSCFYLGWAAWLYSISIILIIFILLPFTIFGIVVTSKLDRGGEYIMENSEMGQRMPYSYSKWLRKRVDDPVYWSTTVRTCLISSGKCSSTTSQDFLTTKHFSPIQSGCCNRPSVCGDGDSTVGEGDCYRWSDSTETLCYNCESCKAAVLEETRMVLHTLSVVNFMVLVVLIVLYIISCYALKNVRRSRSDYGYEENRMTVIRPRWDYYCLRRLCQRLKWLY